jgi:glycerophosphodiester phosphodiesterase
MFSSLELTVPNSIALGGHRGKGMNLKKEDQVFLGIRENTIRSFVAVSRLPGVSFVEFDVQVSRDGVPVIWHDDDIVSGDPSAPTLHQIKDLTVPELKALTMYEAADHTWSTQILKSTGQTTPFTRWACEQDDEIPTLEALFDNIDESVGFNVEVKMTTPSTVKATPQEEVDRVVNPTLEIMNKCSGGKRVIVYSSFDPDVCLALKQRQSTYPVMFLSNLGQSEQADPRRASIGAALNFASTNGLEGVVVPASGLMAAQEMVAEAKALRLKVMTYGLDNNSPEVVAQQGKLGVLAAIVDDVTGLSDASSAQPEKKCLHAALLDRVASLMARAVAAG